MPPRKKRELREWTRPWLTAWRASPARDYSENRGAEQAARAESSATSWLQPSESSSCSSGRSFADAQALVTRIAAEIARGS